MEKKAYETPQLQVLGSVQELTAQPDFATNCSALEDASTQDNLCESQNP